MTETAVHTRTHSGVDTSDMILHACLCGSLVWNLKVMFDEYAISCYFTAMTCDMCGAEALAPTPIDHPDYIRSMDMDLPENQH